MVRWFLSAILIVFVSVSIGWSGPFSVEWVKLQGPKRVEVKYQGELPRNLQQKISIHPAQSIQTLVPRGEVLAITTRKPFQLDRHYYLTIEDVGRFFIQPDGVLDSLYSDKPLGCIREEGSFAFRLFAPRARWVRLVLFSRPEDDPLREFPMVRDDQGVWEFTTREDWSGKFYGYRVAGPTGEGEMFDSTIVIADPYGQATATQNHFLQTARTLILPPDTFDWEGDTWLRIPWRDLIIYEMHIRDMTAHPSSGLPDSERGYYTSLIREDQHGGLPYIRSLGVNAVELLPAQDFANIEPPYNHPHYPGLNSWNPYERNHWGYMTSYFFSPESYYASGSTLTPGIYLGTDGRQVREFKEMVKAFHRNGIAVLMDVVYNHTSNYDYVPFKYIDKFYYYRINPDGSFSSRSGCGNDFKSERPMARRFIVDNVTFWMEEYHIDGFRFDQMILLDWETVDEIARQARRLNPGVILIAEPWVWGGYAPDEFSRHGYAAWNDWIRNGVKGQNPHEAPGFIFGRWQGNNTRKSLQNYVMGTLEKFGGLFQKAEHSVNYLESHDDHTLGDFIRLALGEVQPEERITDLNKNARLSRAHLKRQKLGALFLFTSQGIVMMSEGQEFSRSKVIVKTEVPDTSWGRLDHNSYNKDNQTNWINFDHARMNQELVNYYRGLIQLRKQFPAFRWAEPENYRFMDTEDELFLVYELNYQNSRFLVALNGNAYDGQSLPLPEGNWRILADEKGVYLGTARQVSATVLEIPPTSGVVLMDSKP